VEPATMAKTAKLYHALIAPHVHHRW
jgi:hypothetical protein